MTFPLENMRRTWSELRPLVVAVGLQREAEELDALLVESRRPFDSPDTWQHQWQELWLKVREQVVERLSSGEVGVPVEEILSWQSWKEQHLRERAQKNLSKLKTARGLVYQLPFLLAWQHQQKMIPLLESAPSIRSAAGSDLATALETDDKEHRLRARARAIAHLAETVYKPQLRILWQILAWLADCDGQPGPSWTCGQLMNECEKLWKQQGSDGRVPDVSDFLDWEALAVRNAAQHPETLRFDLQSGELVSSLKGKDRRWTETDLRQRAAMLMERCHVMSLAIAHAGGAFDAIAEHLESE